MSSTPTKIDFETYTDTIPKDITIAVEQAANRVLANRGIRVAEYDNWEEMRQAASDLRLQSLLNLDYYINQFSENLTKAGGQVHWAENAEEARKIALEIAQSHNVRNVVKVKSMATEEIGLNAHLQKAGMRVTETDLGEYIIQLDGTGPSHIIIPAIHLKKEKIAQLFHDKLGSEITTEPEELTAIARKQLRQEFLQADMGVSGANFLIAETGTLVIVTNEGNGRFCTTLPDLHVAVVGIDKIIPDWESAALLLRMLARSATGQKITAYNSFITGPRQTDGEYGAKEMHVILLDNGRSRILADPHGRETLKCIRCGSCLNACPIYKNVGGFAYGWFISGPIGAIFTPQIAGTAAAAQLPFASSLCGACVDVCPVKVPITDILLHLRHRVAEGDEFEKPVLSSTTRTAVNLGSIAFRWGWLYRFGTKLLPIITRPFVKQDWMKMLPPPLNRWTKVRPFPAFTGGFRSWIKKGARKQENK